MAVTQRHTVKLAATAALITASCGMAILAAAPAGAAARTGAAARSGGGAIASRIAVQAARPESGGVNCTTDKGQGSTATFVYGGNSTTCTFPDGDTIVIRSFVTIDKDGKEVASGLGFAMYTCNGTAENTFEVNDATFQAACG